MHGLVALTNIINKNSKGATLIIKFLNWAMRWAVIVFICAPFFFTRSIGYKFNFLHHVLITPKYSCQVLVHHFSEPKWIDNSRNNLVETLSISLVGYIFSMYQHQIDICDLGFCILCAKIKTNDDATWERALTHFYTDMCVIVVSICGAGGRRFYRHN